MFKKFKKIAAGVAAVGLLGITLSACSTAEKAISEADCGSDEAFCIGLVTDIGKVDDKSFNNPLGKAHRKQLLPIVVLLST